MRILALIQRTLRQFYRDKRTLALMLLAPMLILLLMSLVFDGEPYEPDIAFVDVPPTVIDAFDQHELTISQMNLTEADEALGERELDAYIAWDGASLTVKLEGSDPAANQSILMMLQQSIVSVNSPASAVQPTVSYLHGSDAMAPFDNFGPVLIGVFSFFFVFLISGVAFLRERTGGTLERLLATPLRRVEIVLGYVGGFGLFTMLQAALIAWFSIVVLDMLMTGSFVLVLLITLLLAMTALTLGTFLSAFANNEFQMIQFIPLVIVPQIFFCGLFSLETMIDGIRWLHWIMPLSYGAEALRDIMIRGAGWEDVAFEVFVLCGFIIFFMSANVLALKKHRKI